MVTVLDVALIAGAAGCATGLGAFPTLLTDKISHRVYDAAVGLAAGIMFGAAVFALLGLALLPPLCGAGCPVPPVDVPAGG